MTPQLPPPPAQLIEPVRDADFGFGLLPWARGPLWRLTEDYTFSLAPGLWEDGPLYTIPRSYAFDKASVPPFFWGPPFNYIPDGLCTLPALEHDFLCDLMDDSSWWLGRILGDLPPVPPPELIHEHFERRLYEAGVRRSKARAMGLVVKLFGPRGKLRFF